MLHEQGSELYIFSCVYQGIADYENLVAFTMPPFQRLSAHVDLHISWTPVYFVGILFFLPGQVQWKIRFCQKQHLLRITIHHKLEKLYENEYAYSNKYTYYAITFIAQ